MSAESIRLRVEVEGDGIIVTMSGTAFRVIYRKQTHTTGLVAFDVRGSPGDVDVTGLVIYFSVALIFLRGTLL
jgi:hypothetical protein